LLVAWDLLRRRFGVRHHKFPLNLSQSRFVLMVILRGQRFVLSMNTFMPASDAAVYARPSGLDARLVDFVKFFDASTVVLIKVG
jgi:hypothetical protein